MKNYKNQGEFSAKNKEIVKENTNAKLPKPSIIDHNIKKEALGPNTRR